MEDHVQVTLLVATVALCAIVGVYYIMVRKNKSAAQAADRRSSEVV